MTDVATHEILATLREDVNLNRATPQALAELADHVVRVQVPKGEYVFRTGDAATQYYVVEQGHVVLTRESASGKAFTYVVAKRGIPLNSVACFRERAWFFSARASEQATLLAIPSPIFREWVLVNPAVAVGIINTMGDLLDGAYTRILDMIDGSVDERICNALTMLSARIGPELPLTNADVADLVGTSRETAARVVSRLQQAGVIAKTRGKIHILDSGRLAEAVTSPIFTL